MDHRNLLQEENNGGNELSAMILAQSQTQPDQGLKTREDSMLSSSPSKDNNARTDLFFKEHLTKRLRQLKLFPIFGDQELSKISVNYWLYLEFFHSAIQLLGKVFAVAVLFYIVQTYVLKEAITSIGSKYYNLYVIIMGIVLVCFRLRGESNLIRDKLVFQFQWTEDLFCLLIENIPNKTSSDELVAYFNSLLPLRITGGYVRNILLIKDYYDYASILKKLEELNKQLEENKEMDDATRNKIESQKQKWIAEISAEENRLKVSSGHHGKAIVTFNNIFTRNMVYNQLQPSFVRSITASFVNLFTSDLKSKMLCARELPEPQDLVFGNICYSSIKESFRTLFAYGSGMLVASGFMALVAYIQINNNQGSDGKAAMHPYVISLILIVINTIMEVLYRFLNGFYIHLSESQIKMNLLNYSIYTSITLYLVFQTIFILYSGSTWDEQLTKTIAMYGVKTVGKKFGFMLLNTKYFNDLLEKLKRKDKAGKLSASLISKAQDKSTDFDYVGGLTKVIPILVMSFGFMILKPLVLLPAAMISLYLMAALDKHRIIKYCEPFTLNSARFMLQAWKVFQWDHFCVFYGAMTVIVMSESRQSINPNLTETYTKIGQSLIAFYLVALLFFKSPSSLKDTFKDQFIKDNSRVFYDSICNQFTSLYHKCEPSYHFGTYSWKSQQLNNI